MVNIQIRGNLIDIEITSMSRYHFDNLSSGELSADNIKDFIKNSSDCETIYKNNLPIIEQNSELQVTSFENENYYDDGYTFLRANLNSVNSRDVNLKIPLGTEEKIYITIFIKYGYGAAFETELMDLDYRNFENNDLQSCATRLFGGTNRVITSMKLDLLPLEDLKRSKYDIISEQILFFEKNYNNDEINLSSNLEDQGKIMPLNDDNIIGNKD